MKLRKIVAASHGMGRGDDNRYTPATWGLYDGERLAYVIRPRSRVGYMDRPEWLVEEITPEGSKRIPVYAKTLKSAVEKILDRAGKTS